MGKARTSAIQPVRLSATLNLTVPSSMPGKEEDMDRRMGKGPRRWTVNRWTRRGRQIQFLAVSHWSLVPSSIPGNQTEREREKEGEGEREGGGGGE